MLIIYVDETGDPNGSPAAGGSREYALGVVVLPAVNWRPALDSIIAMRRSIRSTTGLPMTAEIKASYLVRNEGWFKGGHVRPSMKQRIVRDHFRLLPVIGAEAFAVWVDKAGTVPLTDVKTTVWNMLYQRLQKSYPGQPFLLFHDEGDESYIRKHARRARRFLTAGLASGGSVRLDVERLLDDPVSRVSRDSYSFRSRISWLTRRRRR